MKYPISFLLALAVLFTGCTANLTPEQASAALPVKSLTKADKILEKAYEAHGGALYQKAHYGFVFRKKQYTFKNDGDNYQYTVTSDKNGKEIIDELSNSGFKRTIDGQPLTLTDREIGGYSRGLNSVIYFATLPHKLNDPAVNKSYAGITTVKGKDYHLLAITFDQENGGKDHDDEFLYWINKESNRIDYLAYNYQVNKGGVRFRSAYNPRVVDGILFQDYVNLKAPVGTPLADLSNLFEQEKLDQLSLIETETVVNLSK